MKPETVNSADPTKEKIQFLTALRGISVARDWEIGTSWEVLGGRRAFCGTPQADGEPGWKTGKFSLVEEGRAWRSRCGANMSW